MCNHSNANNDAPTPKILRADGPKNFLDAVNQDLEEVLIDPSRYCQWSCVADGKWTAAGATKATLPPGIYRILSTPNGLVFDKLTVVTDSLVELGDDNEQRVLHSIRKFWGAEQNYIKHNIAYRRGILLYGPPGGGKTSVLLLLANELVRMGGIVVYCEKPEVASEGMSVIRKVEPNRQLILILEDIDEIIHQHKEHSLLALLDGENRVSNVVNLATTNYAEMLPDRIINRPSRFDERIKIGMPSAEARRSYLEHIATTLGGNIKDKFDVERWVVDTNGFSIAHLRELVAAVLCLDDPYQDVLDRLKSMSLALKEQPTTKAQRAGFDI